MNHLVKLGLNNGEAKVYISLLNNGDLTATELADKSGLGRTNVYNYAKTLQEKGLITDYERNSKVFFQASDPKELYAMIDSQKKSLNNLSLEHFSLLPRFNKLYNQQSKTPKVRLYLGKKDWKKLMKILYLEQEAKEMFVLTPDLDEYIPPSPIYQNSLYNNNVFVYLVTNTVTDIELFTKKDAKKNRKTIIIPKSILPITDTTIFFKNQIFTGNFSMDNLLVYSIEDKKTIKMMVSMFKALINLQ